LSAAGDVRVLVADDAPRFREALRRLIEAEAGFRVVGAAADGEEAAALARAHRPDVIAIDLELLGAEGRSGIPRILAETPTPILVLAATPSERAAFRALSLGALDILGKPAPQQDPGAYGAILRLRLRRLAGVKAIRHPTGVGRGGGRESPRRAARRTLVVIGASLGGPRALAQILRALPADLPVPVAVVQHIADGFAEGLASWLDLETPLEVRTASDGQPLLPGRVLIAPGGRHLEVAEGRVRLSDAPPVETLRPSVNPLFTSAARVYGPRACGLLLTGLGRDGADGLRALRDAGGYTMAQDEATSAVFGMPRAAVEAGAVDRVLALEEIPGALLELVR
jgi:two-component system, chemotaxis family, protein-glutamate methylesterase/glutaminase